jgi:MFS family permease
MAEVLERRAYVRMLSAVYAALFLIRVAFGVVIVTFPLYVSQGAGVLGLLLAASPLFELLAIFFAPWFITRFGRKGILLTGLALGAVALYALALTREPLLLGMISTVQGVAAGFILVTTLAVIATYAAPAHRAREMGLFNFVNVFGIVCGYVAGSALAKAFAAQLEYTFVIAGALATLGLLYANRVIQLPPADRAAALGERPSLRRTLRTMTNGRILLLVLPWLVVWMLVASVLAFSSRVTGALKVDTGNTILTVLGLGALLVIAQLFWGRLADRKGKEGIMLVGAVGLTLLMGTVVYAFFSVGTTDLNAVFDAVLAHRVILVIFLFAALAFAPAGLAAIADEAERGSEGSAMSAYALTLSLGFIVGPPVVGQIAEIDQAQNLGGRAIVLFFAAAATLVLALVLAHYVRARAEAKEAAA